MAFDLDAAIAKRVDELIADLPPLTEADCRAGAAILATARPPRQLPAAG